VRLGLATSAIVIGYAVVIGAIRAGVLRVQGSGAGDIGPSDADIGALWLTLAFAAPGVIGAIGSVRHRGWLLTTAGILCIGQSIVAFSGVAIPFVIPGIVLLPLGSRAPGRVGRRSVAFGATIVGLVIASWVAGLGMTETRCWTATRGPDGTLVYADAPDLEANPETGEGGTALDGITIAEGCDGGVLTASGAVVGIALLGAAGALAAVASRDVRPG